MPLVGPVAEPLPKKPEARLLLPPVLPTEFPREKVFCEVGSRTLSRNAPKCPSLLLGIPIRSCPDQPEQNRLGDFLEGMEIALANSQHQSGDWWGWVVVLGEESRFGIEPS